MVKKEVMEQDFTSTVEAELPKLIAEACGNINKALEGLFALEKQTRTGGDFTSCSKVARAIVRICYDAKDWSQLNETLVTLSKRRSQSKTVIQAAVQEAMSVLDHIDQIEIVTELVKTLRTITEGKIFVELESAELTKRLADIYERQGNIKEAAKVLQEVQVETLSKMEQQDKVNYILDQVSLCLKSNDFIRALIVSRKINKNTLNQENYQKEKVRYYLLMVEYYRHENDQLEIARCYQSLFYTPSVQSQASEWSKYLRLLSIYTVLSPFSSDQNDLINRTASLKQLSDLPLYKKLLKQFLTVELMSWPQVSATYRDEFQTFPDFQGEPGTKLWEQLHLRVVEHNIRVIAAYYKRISTARLCQLLDLPVEVVEERLSTLVVNGSVYAKIDRPAGIINFSNPKAPVEHLNDWKSNISDLLYLIEKTCHLIQRETMVSEAKVKGKR